MFCSNYREAKGVTIPSARVKEAVLLQWRWQCLSSLPVTCGTWNAVIHLQQVSAPYRSAPPEAFKSIPSLYANQPCSGAASAFGCCKNPHMILLGSEGGELVL
jgi:hypothetical protein